MKRASMRWEKSEIDQRAAKAIVAHWRVHPLLAAILARRNILKEDEVKYFISRDERDQHDPFHLRDMRPAIRRVRQAKERREKALIFGDRDVDGITATVVLVKGLMLEGVECQWRVPCEDDAYGLSVAAIEEAERDGVSLIITVDCGISNHQEIAEATRRGIDTIVIDHHNPPDTLPPALAVINPKQADCAYPYKFVSGCTLAYKFALALREDKGATEGKEATGDAGATEDQEADDAVFSELVGLAAISTIADMMPLLDENRTIVDHGIQSIARAKSEGIRALLRKRQLPLTHLTARTLAFNIIPLINAAGRFGRADRAVHLLLTEDIQYADQLADELTNIHQRQKKIIQDTWKTHYQQAQESYRDLNNSGVIVAGEDILAGVTGLLANKFLQEFRAKMAVVISRGKDATIGSIRCDRNWRATEIIAQFAEMLPNWGGHDRAAGFTIAQDSYERFLDSLRRYAQTHTVDSATAPVIQIDAEIPRGHLNNDLFELNSALEPFGQGFPPITYCTSQVSIANIALLGKDERHAKLLLDTGATKIEAVFWNCADYFGTILKTNNIIDILYHVEHNHFRHNVEKRLSIIDAALHA